MNVQQYMVCSDALHTFGFESQRDMLIEECGELITAMAREPRGRSTREDILTELADVSIMVHQLAMHYGYDDFLKERDRKIWRLNDRLVATHNALAPRRDARQVKPKNHIAYVTLR